MSEQAPGKSRRGTVDDSRAWTLAGLIDLEILVREDEESQYKNPGELQQRDRAIYNQFPAGNGEPQDRRHIFHFWLDARRKERFRGRVSIGEEILSALFWIRIALFLAGLLLARGAVWSFFRGAELSAARPEPINVLWFGSVCIALPFLVTLCGLWVLLGRSIIPRLPMAPAFLRGTLFDLIRPLLQSVARRASESVGAGNELNARAMVGALKLRVESRKSAISAKIFHLVQAFGVAFTLGVLVFSWLDCMFYNRVFGWQTTSGAMSAASVYDTVKFLALPWSWLQGAGTGYPSLAQVEQTNFVRFHDPVAFPPAAAPAWAAFLIWSALIYGFLPRLFLARMSARQVAAALRTEDFSELRFENLWERMTLGRGAFLQPEPDGIPRLDEDTTQTAGQPHTGPAACKIILPSEIHTQERAAAIAQWMDSHKQWHAPAVEEFGLSLSEKTLFLGELKAFATQNTPVQILVIQESFMPPTREFLDFLPEIRGALGAGSAIFIGLLGKPDGTPLAGPPKQIEAGIWKKKILSLGDPNMEAFSFLPPV